MHVFRCQLHHFGLSSLSRMGMPESGGTSIAPPKGDIPVLPNLATVLPKLAKQSSTRSMWTFGNSCLRRGDSRTRTKGMLLWPWQAPKVKASHGHWVWTECYSTLAAILSTAYPSPALQHFRIITRATIFSALHGHLMTLPAIGERQTKSLYLGLVDPALYNEAFTGRTKEILRCHYCLESAHTSSKCIDAPRADHRPQEAGTPSERSGHAVPEQPVTRPHTMFLSCAGLTTHKGEVNASAPDVSMHTCIWGVEVSTQQLNMETSVVTLTPPADKWQSAFWI